jgi:hypothetical protein
MTEARRFGFVDMILFVLVLTGSLGARVWYLSVSAENAATEGPLQVQDALPRLDLPFGNSMNAQPQPNEMDALIHNLKTERWYGTLAPFASAEEPTAHVSPGYPWFRYWLEAIPGLPAPIDASIRWLQAGLGAITAGFYFLFARRAFQNRMVALLSGAFCAVHPFWIINTAELNDGVLASFLLGAAVYLGVSGGQRGGALTSLLYGLSLAGLALVRAALLPFAFVALLWFLLRSRLVPRGWLCAILAFLGFANGLAPWTVRNFQVFHDVVPIVNSAFYHLWIGNNDRATGGPMSEKDMWEAVSQARGEDVASTALALGAKNQRDRFIELGKIACDEVRSNPIETLKRRLWAGLYFFFGQKWFEKENTLWRGSGPTQPGWLADWYKGILYGALLFMLWLGVIGWRWSYGWRAESMPASLAVFWVPLPYLLSHAESLMGPRLPLDGVLLTYAALAVASMTPLVGQGLFAGPTDEAPADVSPPLKK